MIYLCSLKFFFSFLTLELLALFIFAVLLLKNIPYNVNFLKIYFRADASIQRCRFWFFSDEHKIQSENFLSSKLNYLPLYNITPSQLQSIPTSISHIAWEIDRFCTNGLYLAGAVHCSIYFFILDLLIFYQILPLHVISDVVLILLIVISNSAAAFILNSFKRNIWIKIKRIKVLMLHKTYLMRSFSLDPMIKSQLFT